MGRPKKYPDELMQRAVRLALEGERPIAHIAADLGMHPETLRKKVRQAEADMVVFGLIGYFLIRAAIDYNPDKAVGLDGALAALGRASYGPVLLGTVAAGLIGFAAYSVADARYRRV